MHPICAPPLLCPRSAQRLGGHGGGGGGGAVPHGVGSCVKSVFHVVVVLDAAMVVVAGPAVSVFHKAVVRGAGVVGSTVGGPVISFARVASAACLVEIPDGSG